MNKIFYARLNKETNMVEGYYVEEIHGREKCDEIISEGGVPLSEELWQELLSYGQAKVDMVTLSTVPQTMPEDGEFCFNMEHSEHFSKVVPEPVDPSTMPPTPLQLLEEKVNGMEEKLNKILVALSVK